jgi:hypothetical protein
LTVGGANASILVGEEDVRDWDDEELLRGKRRGKYGFIGRAPTMVPQALHQERIRRKLTDTIKVMQKSSKKAAIALADIAMDPDAQTRDRLTAIRMILEWSLGKPHQSVDLAIAPVRPYEEFLAGLAFRFGGQAGALPDGSGDDIIDVETVEDDDDWTFD